MKELLILSGKGGTGKTTVAGAFLRLAAARACADCDVDAPNLHLLLRPASVPQRRDYFGMAKAVIDQDLCLKCGKCAQYCRFHAIGREDTYRVYPFFCEGCGVCEEVCPEAAISLQPYAAGELSLYRETAYQFSTARLNMGSGTTGLLVTEVKKQIREEGGAKAPLAIIDGSPGIGCPVIASLSGVSMVLAVAEPSLSGISDLKRILRTAEIFQTKAAVCINKYDVNFGYTRNIEAFSRGKGYPVVGKIPFDLNAVRAVNEGKTVVDTDCPAGRAVKTIFERTISLLYQE